MGTQSSPTRRRWRRHGAAFTLVELLVVIALVALLVGLLLAGLRRVREVTLRTTCATRLHQVGIAVGDYGLDHFGLLPTRYEGDDVAFDSFWMRSPDGDRVNLGLLMDRVGTGPTFYCPTQTERTSPRIGYDTSSNPWRVLTAAAPQPRREAPVGLNAAFAVRPENGGGRWSMSNYSNKVIYSDFIGVRRWASTTRFPGGLRAPHRGQGYNRLVGDGSVPWVDHRHLTAVRAVDQTAPSRSRMRDYYQLFDVLP